MLRRPSLLLLLCVLPLSAGWAGAAPVPEPVPVHPSPAFSPVPPLEKSRTPAPLEAARPGVPDEFTRDFVRSLSTGCILVIIAVGLLLIFGLTGVINLAQGEMVTIGAYTAYVMQSLFGDGLALTPFGHAIQFSGWHRSGWTQDYCFLASLPLSFFSAALVGVLLERCVIRFLYARPLECLLATWGLSQVLRLVLRSIFGPGPVTAGSPGFLDATVTVGSAALPVDQLFVVGFAALVVVGVWLLLKRTSFGLLLRSVTQDPVMAACIGVRPQKVNLFTFALGCGLAGLAGALLTLVTATGPELGHGYLADGVLVAMFSGVGHIVGAVLGGVGLGWLQQFLAHSLGVTPGGSAAGSQLLILAALLVFFQWRPAGLFGVTPRNPRV